MNCTSVNLDKQLLASNNLSQVFSRPLYQLFKTRESSFRCVCDCSGGCYKEGCDRRNLRGSVSRRQRSTQTRRYIRMALGFCEKRFREDPLLTGRDSFYVPLLLTETQTMLGPVVLVGPSSVQLKKPLIVSFQHSASVKHGNWAVSVCGSFTPYDEPPEWQVRLADQRRKVLGEFFCSTSVNVL